jgi:hypothetical protein
VLVVQAQQQMVAGTSNLQSSSDAACGDIPHLDSWQCSGAACSGQVINALRYSSFWLQLNN